MIAIAAVCENGGIGREGALLFHIREDLRRFRQLTLGKTVVMTCQGGCVGGAGQPYGLTAAKKRRGAGLYEADSSAMFKRAEKNPIVTRLLEDYGPDRCHELLHVHYGE